MQIDSRTQDCAQDWTTAMVQHLFPSPDRVSFTPNQGPLHDPLSRLKPETIGQLLDAIQHIDQGRLKKEIQYFSDTRKSLVDLVYQSAFKKAEGKPMQALVQSEFRGKKLSEIYESQSSASSHEAPLEYLNKFREVHEKVSNIVHFRNPETGKENTTNRDLLTKRRVAEDFVNTLLGTLLESMNHPSPYPKNAAELSLLTYFWKKSNSRSDVLSLFKKVPHLLEPQYEAWLKEEKELKTLPAEVREERQKWLDDRYTKADYTRWQIDPSTPYFEEKARIKEVISNPELLAFVSYAFDYYESYYPPFVNYGVAVDPILAKRGIDTYSNCGEVSIELLLNALLYHRVPLEDPSDNFYDVDFLKKVIQHHDLKPYRRMGDDRVKIGLVPFYKRNSQPKNTPLDKVRNDFGQHVFSNLNLDVDPDDHLGKVEYVKPHDGPVCEIHPGFDNFLKAITRVLGDYKEEGSMGQVTTRSGKLDRFLKLFSAPGGKWTWKIEGSEDRNKIDQGPDFGFTVVFAGPNQQKINIEFEKKHFAIQFGQEPLGSWRRAYSLQIIQKLLKQAKSSADARLTNLGWFLDRDTFKAIAEKSPNQLESNVLPFVLYSTHFNHPERVNSNIRFVLNNEREELYPAASQWFKRIDRNYHGSIGIHRELIQSLVQNLNRPGIKPLLRAAMVNLPYALRIATEMCSPVLLHELLALGKLTAESITERGGNQYVVYLNEGSPLYIAVEKCDADLVGFLIKSGNLRAEQILQRDGVTDSLTILDLAIVEQNVPMVRMILEKVQSPQLIENLRDRSSSTPLHTAVYANNLEIVKLLFDVGKISSESLLMADESGATPLHAAISKKNLDMMKFLLEQAHLSADQISEEERSVSSQVLHLLARSLKDIDPHCRKELTSLIRSLYPSFQELKSDTELTCKEQSSEVLDQHGLDEGLGPIVTSLTQTEGKGNRPSSIIPLSKNDPRVAHLKREFVNLGKMYLVKKLIWSGIAPKDMNQGDAEKFCRDLGARLPTAREFFGLAKEKNRVASSPPDTRDRWFWLSPEPHNRDYDALFVGNTGYVDGIGAPRSAPNSVMCVH
jgi:hypothetical protein